MALVAEAVVADPAPAGVVIEQVEYDPYGRVRRTATADFDHSGVVEVPDIFAFLSARAATSPSADHDWDGDADVPDYFAFLSVWFAEGAGTTARDQLSSEAIDNPIGYCGYYHDRETVGIMGAGNGGLYQVRHRVYDPHAGRWLQRDPAGFVDGCNLYEYCMGGPGSTYDPMGLDAIDDFIEASAGLGDGMTFGLTYLIREAWNGNTVVDTSSANYQVAVGVGAATTVGMATFGVGTAAAGAAGLTGAGKIAAAGAFSGLYADAAYQSAMIHFGRQSGYDVEQAAWAVAFGGLTGPFMEAIARMLGPLHPLFHRFAQIFIRSNADDATTTSAANSGVPVQLRPYRGPGGGAGHHVPAKSAFEGDPIYNANRALAVPVSELRALGVNHAVVTGAQKTLYTQARHNGLSISWELMERVETQALIRGGMSPELAPDVVRRSISSLKQQGCTPQRIPWGP